MTTAITIRVGFVSGRLKSPSAMISNLIRRVVPSSGRSYYPVSSEWVISAARLPALMGALRAAGVEVVEHPAVQE